MHSEEGQKQVGITFDSLGRVIRPEIADKV